jgi:hypothetical protein
MDALGLSRKKEAGGTAAVLQSPAALDDAYQHDNNRDNQQNMDESAHGVGRNQP